MHYIARFPPPVLIPPRLVGHQDRQNAMLPGRAAVADQSMGRDCRGRAVAVLVLLLGHILVSLRLTSDLLGRA
jgi:hypothetical protein